MITLEVADLVIIASRTIGLGTGQVLDLLDADAAEIALARALPGPTRETRPARPPPCCARSCRASRCGTATSRSRWRRRCSSWPSTAGRSIPTRQVRPRPGRPGPPPGRSTPRPSRTGWRPGYGRRGQREGGTDARPSALPLARGSRKRRCDGSPGHVPAVHRPGQAGRVLAQEEARLLGHDYVAPSTSCSALLYEGEGVAAKALESLGISREQARGRVEEITGRGQGSRNGHLPFTPRPRRRWSCRCGKRWPSGTPTSAPSTCCWACSLRATASAPRC